MKTHVTAQSLPSASSTSAWRNAVMVLFAIGGVAVSTWGPRLPSIRESLGVGDAVIGVVLASVTIGSIARDGHNLSDAIAALFFTAFAIGETTARVVGGPLVDRVGRVVTVRFTIALGVVGLLLFIFGGPVWGVLIGTVLWAIGVSMGFPLGMSAAAESGPDPAA